MSDTLESLRRQIGSATDLQAVVRTMKALAASGIGHYERSVRALADYERTVELGLRAALGALHPQHAPPRRTQSVPRPVDAVVFGSDQGMVGRFNETVAERAAAGLQGRSVAPRVWAVGERMRSQLLGAGLALAGSYAVPASVDAIAPLIGRILLDTRQGRRPGDEVDLLLFYNRPMPGAGYSSAERRLLPLDDDWRRRHAEVAWPSANLPEVVGDAAGTLAALVGEYLFVSLFRACAESLASENASRLAAMERADRNIAELLGSLQARFHQVRQGRIDEELFDLTAGFDALLRQRRR